MPPDVDVSREIALIGEGDELAALGDRGGAVRAWREALAGANDDASPSGRAATAMAALRLVHVEGSLAPFWREGQWTRALRDCPDEAPICRIAQADREWLVPAFAGGDPGRIHAWVGALVNDPGVGPLARERTNLVGTEQWWAQPGTWTLGLGLSYSDYYGAGASVHFVHPDLGWRAHRLELDAASDLSGNWALSSRFVPNLRPALSFSLSGGHTRIYSWEPYDWRNSPACEVSFDTACASGSYPRAANQTAGEIRGSVLVLPGPVRVWVGASARAESIEPEDSVWFDALQSGSAMLGGPSASATVYALDHHLRLRVSTDAQFGGYTHLFGAADLRAEAEAARVHVVGRVGVSTTPLDDEPWWRWPAAGGTQLLRGLPAGYVRAQVLPSAQLEVYRHLFGPVHGALFVDSAWDERAYLTAGGGLRFVLPPGRDNVTRIDVGAGPDGWGVILAWGDAF